MTKKKELRDFIQENHNIVMDYHFRYFDAATHFAKTPFDHLRIVFLNSLEAAGGAVPLDQKLACYKYFERSTSKLKTRKKIAFQDFADCFMESFDSPSQLKLLSQTLENNSNLPHFGNKKANLFLKDLILVAKGRIFDKDYEELFLPFLTVPIDVVIRKVYWHLESLQKPINNRFDSDIRSLASDLFPKSPILFDDIWFWGHFSFKKDKLLKEANQAMIYTDRLLDEATIKSFGLIEKVKKFIKIIC